MNNSKADTSKGGLLSPSMTGFNKLNNAGMTLKKGNLNNSNTNLSLNSNITTSNSQKNLTV